MGESDYSRLSNNPDAIYADPLPVDAKFSHRPAVKQACIYFLIGLFSAAFTIILFVLGPPVGRTSSQKPSEPLIDTGCGHSVEEALTNGCHFDMMASTWEAPECHDAELLAQVLDGGPWQWYQDREHNKLVPREEVAEGRFPIVPLFPDSNYHIGHCMYMWMKQHRAYIKGRAISEDLWDYNHTVHCAKLVMREEWPTWGRTQAGFSVCRNQKGWERHGGKVD